MSSKLPLDARRGTAGEGRSDPFAQVLGQASSLFAMPRDDLTIRALEGKRGLAHDERRELRKAYRRRDEARWAAMEQDRPPRPPAPQLPAAALVGTGGGFAVMPPAPTPAPPPPPTLDEIDPEGAQSREEARLEREGAPAEAAVIVLDE